MNFRRCWGRQERWKEDCRHSRAWVLSRDRPQGW